MTARSMREAGKMCTTEGCADYYYARGMCHRHWRAWKKETEPPAPPGPRKQRKQRKQRYPPIEERFWSKVAKTAGCWEWTAGRFAYGHGQFSVNSRSVPAHRVSYELAHGPIPTGLVIDHMCHNPPCVNPAHLRAVTQKQNIENLLGAHKNSKTGVRGVQRTPSGTYRAALGHHGKRVEVGIFPSLEAAEAAVVAKRNELFTCNDIDRLATK